MMTSRVKHLIITVLVLLFYAGSAHSDESPVEKGLDALNNSGISLSGTLEINAEYIDTDTADTSDILLATAELAIDASPIKHLSGHIVLLFEEDETNLVVDEGFIHLDGEDKCNFFADIGRLYLPFGDVNTIFINDPLPLELGETRETTLLLGYGNNLINISVGVFNGDVNETDQDDDIIDGYTANAVYTQPTHGRFSLSAGLSYLSNLGDSDSLTGQLTTENTIDNPVPALAAFISSAWDEKLHCELAYLYATESFTAGDLAFDGGQDVQPWAVSIELSYDITDHFGAGLRYNASGDGGDFVPESLYGAVAAYEFLAYAQVAIELQTGEYENGSDITMAILQLALNF